MAVQTCVPLAEVQLEEPTLIVVEAVAPLPTTLTVIDCVAALIYAGERFEADALADAAGMRMENCAAAVFVDAGAAGAGELVAMFPTGAVTTGSAECDPPPPPPQPALNATTSNAAGTVNAR